ncbi:MAG: 5-formyltetrahydrofolate cyclo-ligase [Chitinispirillaceae bacterium]|nr:5-formyltetrahydrofolate cyclo-ligase [Chitinispirillaceae bacterium]
MDMGIGFSEVLLILMLVLVFFGSREFPRFVRESARFFARMRSFGEKIRHELDDISGSPEGISRFPEGDTIQTQKKELRSRYIAVRRGLAPAERAEKSRRICLYLNESERFRNAAAVMIYVNIGSEVETRELITEMVRDGKRVLIPYCRRESRAMGLGEIRDLDKDIVAGEGGVPEPLPGLRDRFFRSDLRFIICPGVCFDAYGGRLGRGLAFYDNFLREFRGSVPLFGLAFDCQMHAERLPFSYNDVPMDQIVTETGFKLPDGLAG